MRKALWSAAALIALLSGAAVPWAPRAQAAPAGVEIGKGNAFKFDPAEITVAVNTKVDWTNKSDLQHDVKADNGLFKSALLSKDETYSFTFTSPGEFRYICTVSGHADAGMVGVVKVTGGATTPTTVTATTATTAATGATTAASAGSTTTTAAKGAAGGSTTTTTAGSGVTSTTQAPSVTPTSAPETGGVTTTTAAATGNAEEAAGGEHGSEASKKDDDKSSPVGIAFAAVSTLLLLGICGKLLASRS